MNKILATLLLTFMMLFINTVLIQVGWRLSMTPVFGFADISLLNSFGFSLLISSLGVGRRS